jgi:hypothetical protein
MSNLLNQTLQGEQPITHILSKMSRYNSPPPTKVQKKEKIKTEKENKRHPDNSL